MDDDESQPTTFDRRSREGARKAARQAKRQRRMNVVGAVFTLGIVALVALVATDTLRVGGRGPTLAGGKVTTTTLPGKSDPKVDVAKIKKSTPPRPLSNAAPLRLWIGGDSLSGELGQQLGIMMSPLGIVRTHVDYKVSSGLASNNVRNWPENFTEQQTKYQPEAAIFMVGANDAPIVGSATDSSGTPLWETKYRAQVDRMMDLLVGPSNRTVFWVGSPTLGTRYNHGAEEVDRVMREEAAKRKTVVYIDAYALFSSNGEFSSYLTDSKGDRVRMRVGDGVHFTPAGALFLSQHVYTLLNSRWNLAGQAAPTTPIPYTIEPSNGSAGGVHIGGGHNGGGSSNNGGSNGGSSSSTTTAATAAPTTTAPHVTVPPTSPTTAPPATTPTTSHPPTTPPPTSP
jgi:hypothetical protein